MNDNDEAVRETEIATLLQTASTLTQMMRQHQDAVRQVGARRRQAIRDLRDLNVPYRVIADTCQVTVQALYADLRKHPRLPC